MELSARFSGSSYLGDRRAIDPEFPFEKTRQLPQLPFSISAMSSGVNGSGKSVFGVSCPMGGEIVLGITQLTNFGTPYFNAVNHVQTSGCRKRG